MLRRVLAAVVFTAAVGATASAQDARPPGLDFGRYHALLICDNAYQTLPKLVPAVRHPHAPAALFA